jgi:hypothetical protein
MKIISRPQRAYGCLGSDDCATLSWGIDLFKKIIAEHQAWDAANNHRKVRSPKLIVWWVELWEYALVRGLAFFAFGSTLVELTDFFRSSYFDTPERHKQRRGATGPRFSPCVSVREATF